MKKTLRTTLVAAAAIFGSLTASAQAFDSESLHVQAGIGIGGYLSYASFGDFNQSPALFVIVDKGIDVQLGPGNVGVGGFLGYQTAGYTYNYLGFTDEGRWTNFVLGARGSWHYNELSNQNLDLYGALNLGLVFQAYDYESNLGTSSSSSSSFLYYAFTFGGKYFFTESLGAFAEIGWDIAYLKVGLALSL